MPTFARECDSPITPGKRLINISKRPACGNEHARLWRDQGKREEARELLAPVYGWLIEGFDTLDLKEPKALLDQLSS
jgi:hypothetical protein